MHLVEAVKLDFNLLDFNLPVQIILGVLKKTETTIAVNVLLHKLLITQKKKKST